MPRPKEAAGLALFLLAAAVLFLAVDFSGDYAINDDWGYSTPLRWWAEGRGLHLTHWQSMPLLPQLAAGMAWTGVFGFGQGTLRALVLVFALVGCGSVYAIGRAIGLPRLTAMLAAALPLASPVFVALSYSFMTDIPGAALVLLAVLMFVRHLQEEDGGHVWYVAGLVFLVLAVLVRQTSVGVAVALLIAEPVARGLTRGPLLRGAAAVAAGLGAYALASVALSWTVGLPTAYSEKSVAFGGYLGDLFGGNVGAILQTGRAELKALAVLGLYLMPAAPLFVAGSVRRPVVLIAAALVAGALTLLAQGLGGAPFAGLTGDTLTVAGIGPRLIGGDAPPPLAVTLMLSFAIYLSATVAVAFVVWGLVARRVPGGPLDRAGKAPLVLLILSAGIVYAPHAVSYGAVFDRYALLPSILLSLAMLRMAPVWAPPPLAGWVTAGLVVVFFAGSLLLVNDFLRWQDARYRLIARLQTEQGFAPEAIDGGFEYNNLTVILDRPEDAVSMRLVDPAGRAVRLVKVAGPEDRVQDTERYPVFGGLWRGMILAVRDGG